MRKIAILYTLIGLILLLQSGCVKDKSLLGTKGINEFSMNDSLSLSTRTYLVGNTIILNPSLTGSISNDTSAYEYTWDVYENASSSPLDAPKTIIATSRNLEYRVLGAPFKVGGLYRLTFTAKDKETGISSHLSYQLSIVGNFQKGWLFLEDNNGSADMTMIKSDTNMFFHMYSSLGSYVPLGAPQAVRSTTNTVTDDLSDPGKRLYLVGKNEIVQLDYSTMEVVFTSKDLFFNAPVGNSYQNIQWGAYYYRTSTTLSTSDGLIFNNNKLYYNLVGGFPGVKKWGGMLLSAANNDAYSLYPYMINASNASSPSYVYDNQNKKFLTVGSSSLSGIATTQSDTSKFDMNAVKLTMVNLDSSNVMGRWNCIMKDSTGLPFYLSINCNVTTAAPIATLSKVKIENSNILAATSYTSSTITPHIYYAIGNNIWRYETTSNTTALIYTAASNETITKLYYDKWIMRNGSPSLLVCTYNGTSGKVQYFPIDNFGNMGTTATKTYDGFYKIVDVAYKYE